MQVRNREQVVRDDITDREVINTEETTSGEEKSDRDDLSTVKVDIDNLASTTTVSTIETTLSDTFNEGNVTEGAITSTNMEDINRTLYGEKKEQPWLINEDIQNELTNEDLIRNEKSLLNEFPFHLQSTSHHHGEHDDSPGRLGNHVTDTQNIGRATEVLDQLKATVPDSSARRCIDKVLFLGNTLICKKCTKLVLFLQIRDFL